MKSNAVVLVITIIQLVLTFECPVFPPHPLSPFLPFPLSLIVCFVSPRRPKSTPTPTASLSANGVPTESVDYDRLKQVGEQTFRDLKTCFCHYVTAHDRWNIILSCGV